MGICGQPCADEDAIVRLDTSAQRAGLARGELRRELDYRSGVLVERVVEMQSGIPRQARKPRTPKLTWRERGFITPQEYGALTKGKR